MLGSTSPNLSFLSLLFVQHLVNLLLACTSLLNCSLIPFHSSCLLFFQPLSLFFLFLSLLFLSQCLLFFHHLLRFFLLSVSLSSFYFRSLLLLLHYYGLMKTFSVLASLANPWLSKAMCPFMSNLRHCGRTSKPWLNFLRPWYQSFLRPSVMCQSTASLLVHVW